jgi:transketolase
MYENLIELSKKIRRTIINMANRSKSPHVGSCLSPVDILTMLYFDVMRFEPWEKRDIFILSKGHAAMSLYATLVLRGILPEEILAGYCLDEGTLPAHLDKFSAKGVEVSAGSLGHAFNIGLGMAFGFKKQKGDRRVYAVMGDGEMQEGSIWEGALFGSKLKLDNFTLFLDYNNLQGYGRPTEICSFEPIKLKWEAFGWHAIEVDGHDFTALRQALDESAGERPKIIIARTVKGKGVSFMEDQLVWHYYLVTDGHKQKALEELI